MAEGEDGDVDEAMYEAPYTDAARARLEVAFTAYELAELARLAVPIAEYELNPDGTARNVGATPADAAQVLAAAHRFFEATAAFERLGQSPPSTEGRAATGSRGEAGWWRAYLAAAPLEAARDLDDWVLRHQDGDRDLGTAPVSGGLIRRVSGG